MKSLSIVLILVFCSAGFAAHDKFVFSSIGQTKLQYDLFQMNGNGEEVQRLTATDDVDELSAVYSTDSEFIYYAAKKDEQNFLYRMRTDGSDEPTLLTEIPCDNTQQLSISDAGDVISIGTFHQSEWGSYTYGVYIYNVAENTLTQIAMLTYRDDVGNISPDGTKVICAVNGGDKGLYAIDVNSREMELIVEGEYFAPRYSEDGHAIIATSTNTAGWKYYLNRIDPKTKEKKTFYESIYPVRSQVLINETAYFLKLVETDDSSFYQIFSVETSGDNARYILGKVYEEDETFCFMLYLNCN